MADLDIGQLLIPISVENPVGADLRIDKSANSRYQRLRDMRAAARNAERQQMQGIEVSNIINKWLDVSQLAQEILIKHTKDLEVAAWLTEALLRLNGFAGLSDGFNLIMHLIAQYWETIYPSIDEDGIEAKVMPLVGLNGIENEGTLITPIALVQLTQGQSAGPFSLWQYQQAIELNNISDPEKRRQRIVAGNITLETIKTAAAETHPSFFHKLKQDLTNCKSIFEQLVALLDEKCGTDSPPTSRIRMQLEACLDCVNLIAKDYLILPQSNYSINQEQALMPQQTLNENKDTDNDPHKKAGSQPKAIKVVSIHKTIKAREHMLQQVLQAADYFRKTEPHSPLSYMLERVVFWGNLPLPELLKEMVKEEQALGTICSIAGIEVKS